MGGWIQGLIGVVQMIPSSLKFSMEGATPSFADNEGQTVEAGSQVRLRIKGIRSELNQMYAIGSIREDYLGYEEVTRHEQTASDTDRRLVLSCSSNLLATTCIVSFMLGIGRRAALFMFVTAVYHNLDFSEALEKLVTEWKRIEARTSMFMFSCQSRYPIGTHGLLLKDSPIVALQCVRYGLPTATSRILFAVRVRPVHQSR